MENLVRLPDEYTSVEVGLPQELREVEVFFNNGEKRFARYLQNEFTVYLSDTAACLEGDLKKFSIKILGWKYKN